MTKAKPRPESPPDNRTPMERFNELGKKLMAVPKAEVDAIERKRHGAKRKSKHK